MTLADPHARADGLDASGLPNLTQRLLQRGFSEPEVRGILGENWLRVFDTVWATS